MVLCATAGVLAAAVLGVGQLLQASETGTAPARSSGGSANARPGNQNSPTSPGPLRLVAFGDSVPAGTACGCTNFVSLLGDRIAAARHRGVIVTNDAQPGQDSAGLRNLLDASPAAMDEVADTDVVIVTIGANDVSFSDYTDADCAADHTACYSMTLAKLRSNLTAVVQRILALRHGRPTQGAVVGYWNVWQDGSVAKAKGPTFQQVSRDLTQAVNLVLQQVATASGLAYVDLDGPFHSRNGTSDMDALLAPDGDHPNAPGQQAISDAILRTIPQLLVQPSAPAD